MQTPAIPTRRSVVLSGLTLAAAAAAGPTPSATEAPPAEVDRELLASVAAARAAAERTQKARDALIAAETSARCERPLALEVVDSDRQLFPWLPTSSQFYDPMHASCVREILAARPARARDKLTRRAREIVAAEDDYFERSWKAQAAAGVPELQAVFDEASEAEEATWRRIAAAPAKTPAELIIKLSPIANFIDRSAIEREPDALDALLCSAALDAGLVAATLSDVGGRGR